MVLALEFVLSLVAVERCSKSVAGFFISGWKKLEAPGTDTYQTEKKFHSVQTVALYFGVNTCILRTCRFLVPLCKLVDDMGIVRS